MVKLILISLIRTSCCCKHKEIITELADYCNAMLHCFGFPLNVLPPSGSPCHKCIPVRDKQWKFGLVANQAI
jgi:hypothetical protein